MLTSPDVEIPDDTRNYLLGISISQQGRSGKCFTAILICTV